jgi:hypothetical protein
MGNGLVEYTIEYYRWGEEEPFDTKTLDIIFEKLVLEKLASEKEEFLSCIHYTIETAPDKVIKISYIMDFNNLDY